MSGRPSYLPPREEVEGFVAGALAAPTAWVVEEQADRLDEVIVGVVEKATTARLNLSNDWHQQRYNRLRKWVQEEVAPLSETVANRYFAIVANGSASPFESADWSNTLHGMKLALEAERARHAREIEKAVAEQRETWIAALKAVCGESNCHPSFAAMWAKAEADPTYWAELLGLSMDAYRNLEARHAREVERAKLEAKIEALREIDPWVRPNNDGTCLACVAIARHRAALAALEVAK